jgi:copper chaperone CopZ
VARTIHVTIAGMNAVHAVRAVYTALAGVPGIVRAEVTLGGASVEHDGSVTRALLAEAVAVAGFELVDWREERTLPTL